MADCTNHEYADMYLMYNRADCNGRLAMRMYQWQYPRRHCAPHSTFPTIDRLLRDASLNTALFREQRDVITLQIKETILQWLIDSLSTIIQTAVSKIQFPHTVVRNVLLTTKMYPFHTQKVQLLTEDDYSRHIVTVSALDA
ncbi:hypothetical protein NPIL_684081 [Nephila pilipes]|uniref:Uncharacterized protein n=1 Tax=Nephila pilipes TaxID=299642 RepID=A0A8X6Q1R2_NEPPI|nr:hypothetical protein NPIL_684081 [Nephila pilipes]